MPTPPLRYRTASLSMALALLSTVAASRRRARALSRRLLLPRRNEQGLDRDGH